MNLIGYIIVFIGILILSAVACVVFLLLFLAIKNSFKKEWSLDGISDKKSCQVSDLNLKSALLRSGTNIIAMNLKEKIPILLERLYFSEEDIILCNFYFRDSVKGKKRLWFIANFLPVSELIQSDEFKFAEDGMGNHYFFNIEEVNGGDAPVYFYDHELGHKVKISPSVTHFLSLDKVVIH